MGGQAVEFEKHADAVAAPISRIVAEQVRPQKNAETHEASLRSR